MPTMGKRVTPGDFGSTRKSESPSGAREGSGWKLSGVKRFVPWAHVADVVLVPARGGGDGGGGIPVEMLLEESRRRARLSRGDGGEPPVLLRRAARELDAEAAQDHGGEEGPRVCRAAHLLEHDGELDQRKAGSALLLGEGEAEPAELGHLAPQRLAVAARVVEHGAHMLGLALLVERGAHGIPQEDLVVGEGEVHALPPPRSARVSFGRPRMRSPITFFWISEDPA